MKATIFVALLVTYCDAARVKRRSHVEERAKEKRFVEDLTSLNKSELGNTSAHIQVQDTSGFPFHKKKTQTQRKHQIRQISLNFAEQGGLQRAGTLKRKISKLYKEFPTTDFDIMSLKDNITAGVERLKIAGKPLKIHLAPQMIQWFLQGRKNTGNTTQGLLASLPEELKDEYGEQILRLQCFKKPSTSSTEAKNCIEEILSSAEVSKAESKISTALTDEENSDDSDRETIDENEVLDSSINIHQMQNDISGFIEFPASFAELELKPFRSFLVVKVFQLMATVGLIGTIAGCAGVAFATGPVFIVLLIVGALGAMACLNDGTWEHNPYENTCT